MISFISAYKKNCILLKEGSVIVGNIPFYSFLLKKKKKKKTEISVHIIRSCLKCKSAL